MKKITQQNHNSIMYILRVKKLHQHRHDYTNNFNKIKNFVYLVSKVTLKFVVFVIEKSDLIDKDINKYMFTLISSIKLKLKLKYFKYNYKYEL